MDYVARRQTEAGRNFGLARVTAAKPRACLCQLGPGGAVDGAAHATARRQRSICRVNNRIDIEICDIALDDINADGHITYMRNFAAGLALAQRRVRMPIRKPNPTAISIAKSGFCLITSSPIRAYSTNEPTRHRSLIFVY